MMEIQISNSSLYSLDNRSFDTPYMYNVSMNGSGYRRIGSDPFIPLYIYITVSIFNAIIFLVGLFGNIMVILVIIKVRDMRTPTNFFLLSLSMADMFVLLVCQPAAMMEFYAKDRWYLGAAMCKIVPLMENGMLHVSILTMLAVTAERYNALCHPFKRRLTCTVSTTVKLIVLIWVLGYLLTLPFLLMTNLETANFYDGTPTHVCRTRTNETWRYCYTIFVFVAFFALPFFIIVFMYTKIIRQLVSDTLRTLTRNDPSAVYTLRSRKQVVRMLIFIIVLFFVSLFPIRVVSLWLIFTPTKDVTKIGLEAFLNIISWARILMYVNSAGNPIIYSLTSTKFKIAFSRVLRRYDPCQRNSNTCTTKYSFTRKSRRNGPVKGTPLPNIPEENGNMPPYLVVRLAFKEGMTSAEEPHAQQNTSHEMYPLKVVYTFND